MADVKLLASQRLTDNPDGGGEQRLEIRADTAHHIGQPGGARRTATFYGADHAACPKDGEDSGQIARIGQFVKDGCQEQIDHAKQNPGGRAQLEQRPTFCDPLRTLTGGDRAHMHVIALPIERKERKRKASIRPAGHYRAVVRPGLGIGAPRRAGAIAPRLPFAQTEIVRDGRAGVRDGVLARTVAADIVRIGRRSRPSPGTRLADNREI